jgi:cytochrome c oxidase subunit 1
MLAMTPVDFQSHETYVVVAHIHYVLVTGALFSLSAATYYWLPKWTGVMYDNKLAKWHFWCSLISVNVLFFPMHFVGLAGMPRRIPDYSIQFADWNQIISLGGFAFGLSQLIFLALLIKACRKKGEPVPAKVWDGAEGLEWDLPSPTPYHTFSTPPKIK